MPATPIYPLPVWPSQSTRPSVPFNNLALAIEAMTCRIVSRTVTAQPASPANGDCYIIPSGRTGTQWATFAVGSLALYRSGWYEYTAPVGNLRQLASGELIYWTGSAWASLEVLLGAKGADIASAATTNLANATGWYVQVTGTTTTTALGTAKAGTLRWVVYTGALQLTHNATSLILPLGQNLVTAAGDAALWVSEGSGNWRLLAYQRADGTPLVRYNAAIVDLGDISGAVSINLAAAKVIRARLVGNATLTFTGLPPAGHVAERGLELRQDGTGGYTVTWPASGRWPGGTPHVLSAGANQEDHVAIRVRSDGSWVGRADANIA